MGRIAAVIPCHNYGRFLGQCLESVEAQTRPFDQVIVVDDDSHDETPAVARMFCDRHRGWRYLRVKCGMGPLSRNAGVEATQADFVAHIDADNWIAPRFVEGLMPAFQNSRVGLAYPKLTMVDQDGRPNGNASVARPWDYDELRRRNYIDTCAISRREIHDRVGGWKAHQFLDDWIWALELSRAGWEGAFCDEELVFYRQHSTQTTRTHDYRSSRLRAVERAFELAIVTPFSGRSHHLDRYFDALDVLGWNPGRLRIVAIDNSGDHGFGADLRRRLARVDALASTYVWCPTARPAGLTAAELADDAVVRSTVADATSQVLVRLYAAARGELGTADLVLTWEDDIVPPDGALRMMADELDWHVGAVAGRVRLRFDGNPVLAQRFVSTFPTVRAQVDVPDGAVVETPFTGFGFTLWRRQVWREVLPRVHPDFGGSREYPWYDAAWAKDVAELGWMWLSHGGVSCRHYQADGSWV